MLLLSSPFVNFHHRIPEIDNGVSSQRLNITPLRRPPPTRRRRQHLQSSQPIKQYSHAPKIRMFPQRRPPIIDLAAAALSRNGRDRLRRGTGGGGLRWLREGGGDVC